ncbi:response regulator [Ornithinibacillus massiliensis]|uniref:Response regulator n=1 Tax=Ornithinibacillus massiliensis TaxID=1944633 RepID=A0ABS5MG96_9BACI|nr:response regulator [Ornithinibacillus massiliensis]MBS3680748.1 response regulator [Ornithinibacillus massiliensis]
MIRAILVDDEELSLIPIIEKLKQYEEIEIVKTYTEPTQVLQDLKALSFDVVFVDIEMKKMDGITLSKEILAIHSNVQIVFVTAHSEYAIQAFELNSIDYLLKPVTTKRLDNTIHRLKQHHLLISNQVVNQTHQNQLIVKCFGELVVYYNDHPVSFKTAKVKELFAFFITYRNTYIHRDVMIEKLWPNHDYKKSKIHLHTCLSHLRKMLEQLDPTGDINFKDQHYCLRIQLKSCDAYELYDVVDNLGRVDESNITKLEKAVHLYQEPYLELNGYEWAYEKTQEYHHIIMQLLNEIIQYYEEKDLTKALYYLQFQRKIEPYLDENIKKSMEILLKQNNRSEAIKLYFDYCKLMAEELGLDPSDSIKKVYDSLLTS